MSLPVRVKSKCFVCGVESLHMVMASTNTLGGTPDLDLRPAEMMRSTMPWWIQECSCCGYVSSNLEDPTKVTKEWLKEEAFVSCGGRTFLSELAARFYKCYLINIEDGNMGEAYLAAVHAAWACDDEGEHDNAIHCRKCALTVLEKVAAIHALSDDIRVVRADLLRRTQQFDTLITEYTDVSFSDDLLNKIIAFQVDKARQQDTRCYRVKDVIDEKKD